MKFNKINIFTNNHQSESGISDYIEIIATLLEKNKIEYEISDKILINGVNVLIEEFSNSELNKALKELKIKYPKTQYFLILTEFITYNNQSLGFNLFNKKPSFFKRTYYNISLKAIKFGKFYRKLSLFKAKIYYRVISRLTSDGYEQKTYKDKYYLLKSSILIVIKTLSRIIRLLFFIPKTVIVKTLYILFNSEFSKYILFDVEQSSYMNKRFIGFKKMTKYFDEIFCIHPDIKKQLLTYFFIQSSVLYPLVKVNKSKSNRSKNLIVTTGLQNNYRKKYVDKLNEKLKENNSQYKIILKNFESKQELVKYNYNLNIPLNNSWLYSSPVRIIRCLNQNQLPLVIKKFNDHPLEKITEKFQIENLKNILNFKTFKKKLSKNIKEYNNLANKMNIQFINKIFLENNRGHLTKFEHLHKYSNEQEILLHTRDYFFFKKLNKVFASPNFFLEKKDFYYKDSLSTDKINAIIFFEEDIDIKLKVSTKFSDINQIFMIKLIISEKIININKKGKYYVLTFKDFAIIYDNFNFIIVKLKGFKFSKYQEIYKNKNLLECLVKFRKEIIGKIYKNDSNQRINKVINETLRAKFVLVE